MVLVEKVNKQKIPNIGYVIVAVKNGACRKNMIHFWMKLMDFGAKLGCHQIPDRSFFIKNYQFPVCARCTGVIAGEIVFFVLFFLKVKVSLITSLVLLIPMGLDWGLQYLNILVSNNIRRVVTGLLGGFALTNIYYTFFCFLYNAIFSLY